MFEATYSYYPIIADSLTANLLANRCLKGFAIIRKQLYLNLKNILNLDCRPWKTWIRPHNPDLVTADVKHCSVKRSPTSNESVFILGDGTDQNDKCTKEAINSGLDVDSGNLQKNCARRYAVISMPSTLIF